MKKIINTLSVIIILLATTSCSADNKANKTVIVPTPENVTIENNRNKYTASTFVYEDHRYLLVENSIHGTFQIVRVY